MFWHKCSSLLGPFTSYKENKAMWLRNCASISYKNLFQIKSDCFLHKRSSLLGPPTSYNENKVMWLRNCVSISYKNLFQITSDCFGTKALVFWAHSQITKKIKQCESKPLSQFKKKLFRKKSECFGQTL